MVFAEAIGRGEASLDHVPLQISVTPAVDQGAGDMEAEDASAALEPIQSPVIVEAVLDETRYNIPVALRSRRPYHYPAGQEGDVSDSYLRWTCRTISASGVKLERDRTQEEMEKAMREDWELNQEGRSVLAKAKRERYIFLKKIEDGTPLESHPAGAETAVEDPPVEEGVAPAGPPDGFEGMDEEEKRTEMERRAKLEALPPVTLRGHLTLPITDKLKFGEKQKEVKPRFVKRPGKYYTAQLTTAAEAAIEGDAVRSGFLTSMLVEQGRRRLTADLQLHRLRTMRENKIAGMRVNLDRRQKLLFPEIVDCVED